MNICIFIIKNLFLLFHSIILLCFLSNIIMTTAEIAPLFVFRDNNSAIHSVCFDTINNHPNLFSGSLDGSISIYDTKKFKKISQFNQCHQNAINKLIYSQNNQLVS